MGRGRRSRNERVHMDVCVGTCSQHQWSVSASKAPKRRGATLGARHNAASTHPLTDFLSLSCSVSPSFSLSLSPPFLLFFLYLCIALSLCFSTFASLSTSLASSSVFANSNHLSLSFRQRRARNLRKSSRRHPPSSLSSVVVFRRERIENSSAVQPFPELLSLFFSCFAMTRAGHVLYW